MKLLRGRRVSEILSALGIQPRQFWLLSDLFNELSERGEVLDQLGRNGVALKAAGWLYFVFSALMSVLLLMMRPPAAVYLAANLFFTTVVLLGLLLSETGNSLVNPLEAPVLAHQPINGATYIAAKLAHLIRIVLYLVPGLNAVPALVGLFTKGANRTYPLEHMLAAFAVGFVSALLCCSLFGWMIRFVPARRLKAAGQFASMLPFVGMVGWGYIQEWVTRVDLSGYLPAEPAARWALYAVCAVVCFGIVAAGIRSLSFDYLARVSSIIHDQRAPGATGRGSLTGRFAGRWFGGPAARAGFAYVSRMMLRDWQFRRQFIPLVVMALIGMAPVIAKGWQTDPFSGRFTPAHLLPHILAVSAFFVCNLLAYGNDYKGAWLFLTVAPRVFGPFARGIHALLWMEFVVVPHALALLLLAWFWGLWHAVLFTAYGTAVASLLLAAELRMIDGVPFSRQVDPRRGAAMFPMMLAGAVVIGCLVAAQHFVVFRSPALVAAIALVFGAAAYALTRNSLGAFEDSMRYSLARISGEAGVLYTEVDV